MVHNNNLYDKGKDYKDIKLLMIPEEDTENILIHDWTERVQSIKIN